MRHTLSKLCARCGRTIAWRKTWARDWEAVRCCSDGCRSGRQEATIVALERTILTLLGGRARDLSICPSEAARRIAPEHWRRLMEDARAAARRLAAAEAIEITQRGRVVDPATIRGPVRLRLAR